MGLTRRQFVLSGAAMMVRPLEPTTADVVSLSPGLTHHIVVREGEHAPTGVQFLPGPMADTGALWDGSAFHRVARGPVSNRWSVIRDDRYGRRIPNLSGVSAATPWGTLIAAEADDGVVEVDPATGVIKKLPALGKHPRTGFALSTTADGRVVVYSGALFRFVADAPGSLDNGVLSIATLETQRWIPLTQERPILKRAFKDRAEMLAHAHEAGRLAGGSNVAAASLATHGALVRFGGHIYDTQDLTFREFEKLWPVDAYTIEENALVLKRRGLTSRIATPPRNATFSAPAFARDGRTIFLAVQQGTVSESHWPDGGASAPRSALVAIEGPILDGRVAVS